MTTAEHTTVRAQLDNLENLSDEQFRTVVGFSLPRLFKEVFGDHVDADKDGLKVEVRQMRRYVAAVGGVSILLSSVQTIVMVVQALHLHLKAGP